MTLSVQKVEKDLRVLQGSIAKFKKAQGKNKETQKLIAKKGF